MGSVKLPDPALLVVAAFSRYEEALDWVRRRLQAEFGPIVLESPVYSFNQTDYYAASMGTELKKLFFAAGRIDPANLADIKLRSNAWEEEYAATSGAPEARPVNIDPGYITPAKLVLASTKDFVHRVYLSKGIFAEVTLFYRRGVWEPHPWTFPDYREARYHPFFDRCRDYLHGIRKTETAP